MVRHNTRLWIVSVGLLLVACGGHGSSDPVDHAAAGSTSVAGNAGQGIAGGGLAGGGVAGSAGAVGGTGNTAGNAGGGAGGSTPMSCSDLASVVCSNYGSCAPIYLAEEL